jgi:MOSC domain-containing protein YiiM
MTQTGKLERIWRKHAHGEPMDTIPEAMLDTDRGMVGDVNYRAGRPITVISADAWEDAERQLGAAVDPSARRANLMVRGVPLAESRGKVLRVGPVRIRVRGETRPCQIMDEAHEGLRNALVPDWRGGVFGDVLQGGTVRLGDPVAWEDAE